MPPVLPEQISPYESGAHSLDLMAYTVEDAARVASLGRTALYAEIKAGRLRAHKIGRRTVILAASLRDWLESLPAIGAQSAA